MTQTPIPDLMRRRYLESGDVSYVRALDFSTTVVVDNSISDLTIGALRRNSYYESGGLSYLRIIDSSPASGTDHEHRDYITVATTVPTNIQYLIHDSIKIDSTMTIDGKLVVF